MPKKNPRLYSLSYSLGRSAE